MKETFAQPEKVIISRDKSASIKGMLICLVVLGHNHFFVSTFPNGTWHWLYCFHVSGFFILPFFYPDNTFSLQRVLKNAKRLLWPYTYMFIFLFLVNFFVFKEARIDNGLFNTFLTGDEYRLKEYTGFQYLWFLPAMFSMLIIKDVYTSSNYILKHVLLVFGGLFFVICWIFFFNSPYDIDINKTLAQVSVFSFMLGFGLFFLGITTMCCSRMRISILFPVSILIISLLFFLYGTNLHISRYVAWLSRPVCPIALFIILLRCNMCGDCLLLRKFGKLSLPVYLFHQPINYIICSFMLNNSLSPEMNLIISYIAVMTITFFLANLVVSIKATNKFLFPR